MSQHFCEIDKPTLQTPEHPEVFVLGDAAHIISKEGKTVPTSAQMALQEAEIISKNVIRSLKVGRGKNLQKFKPDYLGKFIALGNGQAVGNIRGHELYGSVARQMKEAALARYLFSTGLNLFNLLLLCRSEFPLMLPSNLKCNSYDLIWHSNKIGSWVRLSGATQSSGEGEPNDSQKNEEGC